MMTRMLLKAFVLGAVAVGFVCTAAGQDARVLSAAGDKYLISAKAGGVNYVEGRVVVARNEGRSGQLLKRDEIDIGDRVSTGSDGRAEILLNPGSYMRIDKDTEFSFASTSLDDLKIKMYSGSAIFEVIADSDFRVSVGMPKAHVELTRSGVYRIDVSKDGTAKLTVWKGAAVAGNEKAEVKAGRTVTIDGGSAVVAKFDKDDKDGLDTWSRDRAKELAKVNASLERRSLRDTLVNSFNGRGWNMYNSFGLWIFDPRRSYYCFMPFGNGWGSPYGFDYAWDIWGLGMPRYIYLQPPPRGNTHPGGNTPIAGGPVKNPAIAPPNNGDTHGRIRPPYTKIEANERGGVRGGVVRGGSNVRGGGDIGGPIFGPPTSSGGGRIIQPSAKDSTPVAAPPPNVRLPVGGGGGKGKP